MSVINNNILFHFLHIVFTIWWDTYTYIFYKITMVHDGPVIQIYTYIYIFILLFIYATYGLSIGFVNKYLHVLQHK